MRIEKRTQNYETTVYVADDGKEFSSQRQCLNYETGQKILKGLESIDRLRIKEADDQIPIHADASYSDSSIYRWYKVNNSEELAEICEVYGVSIRCNKFPTVICMETEDECFFGIVYPDSLDRMKEETRGFFAKFGVKVEFSE